MASIAPPDAPIIGAHAQRVAIGVESCPMVTVPVPSRRSRCQPRQARKGAAVAAALGAEVWLAPVASTGEVSERSKEHAWKVCMVRAIEGSNPSLSANHALPESAFQGEAHWDEHGLMLLVQPMGGKS